MKPTLWLVVLSENLLKKRLALWLNARRAFIDF